MKEAVKFCVKCSSARGFLMGWLSNNQKLCRQVTVHLQDYDTDFSIHV